MNLLSVKQTGGGEKKKKKKEEVKTFTERDFSLVNWDLDVHTEITKKYI